MIPSSVATWLSLKQQYVMKRGGPAAWAAASLQQNLVYVNAEIQAQIHGFSQNWRILEEINNEYCRLTTDKGDNKYYFMSSQYTISKQNAQNISLLICWDMTAISHFVLMVSGETVVNNSCVSGSLH